MTHIHLRGSISSEDVVSLRSGDVSDGHHEDSLSTVTAGSSSAELRRAGSRRPVYLTEDADSVSVRDGVPDSVLDNQVREILSGRSKFYFPVCHDFQKGGVQVLSHGGSACSSPRIPSVGSMQYTKHY